MTTDAVGQPAPARRTTQPAALWPGRANTTRPQPKPPYLPHMRLLAFLCLLPTSLHAWEFTPGLPCRLSHATAEAAIELTYDPTQPLYTVTVTRSAPWPQTEGFQMHFDGPRARRIGTDRHRLSEDGRSLTVADVGFGNVLDGLQFNVSTTAIAGEVNVSFALDGIAESLAAFRACELAQPVS